MSRRPRLALTLTLLASALACLLVGCGTMGASASFSSTMLGIWLCAVSLVGLLSGCGGGGQSDINVPGATSQTADTSTPITPTPTPTPVPTPNVNPTPTPNPTPSQPVPVKLGFVTLPTKAAPRSNALTPLTPAPQVAILDADGNVVTTATNAVTLALGANPGNAVLSGTLTVNAVNGIATFDNVLISMAASGFTLTCSAEGLTGATSAAFTVGPLGINFVARRDFEATPSPNKMTSADFNGDGKLDLAVTNSNDHTVVILPGNADGTLGSPVTTALPASASWISSGDFNHDGRRDLVLTTPSGAFVLLGNGDYTFRAPSSLSVPVPGQVAAGDFNGDRIDDFLIVSGDSARLYISNGDGTFQSPRNSQLPNPSAHVVTVADFDGDGSLDFVEGGNATTIGVLLNDGAGNFHVSDRLFDGNGNPKSLVVADFDGNNIPDIMFSDDGLSRVFPGNGDGTFRSGPAIDTTVHGVAAADLNGDGLADLVILDDNRNGSANVLLGNGDGTFKDRTVLPVPNAVDVVLGRFSATTHDDIVTVGSGSASILSGNGDGTFFDTPAVNVDYAAARSASADFNGDGKTDLAVNDVGGNYHVLLSNGNGQFHESQSGDTAVVTVRAGDFNGDGRPDLAVANAGGVEVMLGNGDGSFSAFQNLPLFDSPLSMAVGDLNGDGRPDLVVTLNTSLIAVFIGNGNGTFQPHSDLATLGNDADEAAIGDVNGDGKADLVATDYNSNSLLVFIGNGDGSFQAGRNGAFFDSPLHVALGDMNGDGRLDVAAGCTDEFGVLLGNGDGTFASASLLAVAAPNAIRMFDINADGVLDLLLPNDDNNVSILAGNGNGTFQSPILIGSGGKPSSLAIGDFNADGKPDLATTDRASTMGLPNTISIMLHR